MSENSKAYKISIRECKRCGIGFCSGYALNEHYKTCGQRGEYKEIDNSVDCGECGVKFPTHSDLLQHNQYHDGTHKYLCRICNRSYQSNPGRLKHEQLEHGSQPLLHCEACGKQFKRKDRLKDHIATRHSLATPHSCPYCDASFKLRDYLRKHCNQNHPGQALGSVSLMKQEGLESPDMVKSPDDLETVNIVLNDQVVDIEMKETGEVDNQTVQIVVKHSDE